MITPQHTLWYFHMHVPDDAMVENQGLDYPWNSVHELASITLWSRPDHMSVYSKPEPHCTGEVLMRNETWKLVHTHPWCTGSDLGASHLQHYDELTHPFMTGIM